MRLYVYDDDSREIVAEIHGDTNAKCEAKAEKLNYDQDQTSWTYSPALGFRGGLINLGDHEVFEV